MLKIVFIKYIPRYSMPFKFFELAVFLTVWITGCASFSETDGRKTPQIDRRDPSYTWSSFFNNDCGPTMKFTLTAEDEAILNYQCSNGKEITQDARKHKRLSEVELWAASDLPVEQLYQLSNGKCRASLIYLGPTHATIEFPCALIRMTVTCIIVSRETMGAATLIQLQPTKALITYSDGFQEFRIDEKRLIPRGPFKPFKAPSPSFTRDQEDNQILAGY
jgi:hypothetical protein